MDAVLSSALRDAIYGWLDRLDAVVAAADDPSLAVLAETELIRLAVTLRALLAEHKPDEDGRCPRCSGWRRRRGYRCSVWVTVHRHLIVDDAAACEVGRHTMNGARDSAWQPT